MAEKKRYIPDEVTDVESEEITQENTPVVNENPVEVAVEQAEEGVGKKAAQATETVEVGTENLEGQIENKEVKETGNPNYTKDDFTHDFGKELGTEIWEILTKDNPDDKDKKFREEIGSMIFPIIGTDRFMVNIRNSVDIQEAYHSIYGKKDQDPITKEQYEIYATEPDLIPEEVLFSIARKAREGKELSPRELLITGWTQFTRNVPKYLEQFVSEEKAQGLEAVTKEKETHQKNIILIIKEVNSKISLKQAENPKDPLSKETTQEIFNEVVVEKIKVETQSSEDGSLSPENKRDLAQFMYFEILEAWQKSQPERKPGVLKNSANWWLEDSKDKKGWGKAGKLALSGTLIALASWAGIEGLDTVQNNNLASRTLSRGIIGPMVAMLTSSEMVKNEIVKLWQRYNKIIVGVGAGAGLVSVATLISIPALFTALIAIGLKMGNKALFDLKLKELEKTINALEGSSEEDAYKKLSAIEQEKGGFDVEQFISKINSAENQQFFKEAEDRILSKKRNKALWKAGREVSGGLISAGSGIATAVLHHTGVEKVIEEKIAGGNLAHTLQTLRANTAEWLNEKIGGLFGGKKNEVVEQKGLNKNPEDPITSVKKTIDELGEKNQAQYEKEILEKEQEDVEQAKKDLEIAKLSKDKKAILAATERLRKETVEADEAKKIDEITKKIDSGMDENAVVDKNLGVTHAFKEQVNADPELGKKLADQIGYKGKIGTGAFYKALGRHFGYIDKNGDEVRVKWGGEDGMAAYKFVKVGDEYKVEEHFLNKEGKWEYVETKGKNGEIFEEKTDDKIENPKHNTSETRDYEYLHKHKVGGGHGKPNEVYALTKQEKELPEAPTDEVKPNGEEVVTGEETQEINYDYKSELGDKYYASSENTWESVYGGKLNPVTGQLYKTQMVGTMGYNPYTRAPSPALITTPAGTGIVGYHREGLIDTDNFELDRPEDIGQFARATGFEDTNFPNGTYTEIANNNREALSQIFVKDIQDEWHKGFKNAMATELINEKVGDGVNSSRDLLTLRMRLMWTETSARPFGATPAFPKGERVDEYLTRAALEAAKAGNLKDIEAKWDKVYADVLAEDLGEKAQTIHSENIDKIFPDYDNKKLGNSDRDMAIKEIKKEFDLVMNRGGSASPMLETSVDKWDPRAQGIVYYVQKLNKLTGLNPVERESAADYTKRCERWLEVHGESKKIELSKKEIGKYQINRGEIKAKMKQMEESSKLQTKKAEIGSDNNQKSDSKTSEDTGYIPGESAEEKVLKKSTTTDNRSYDPDKLKQNKVEDSKDLFKNKLSQKRKI